MRPSVSKDLLNAECAQERLEIVAVKAAIKPVAVLCAGNGNSTYWKDLEKRLWALSLHVCTGPPWLAPSDLETLPEWYSAEWNMRDQRIGWFYISRERKMAQALCDLGRARAFSTEREAELLGYPLCCVRDYHRNVRELHQMNARLIFDLCQGNDEKMRRLVRSGIELRPRDQQEINRFLYLVSPQFAPYTSIAMCTDCRRGLRMDAQRVSQNMKRLTELADPDLTEQLPRATREGAIANLNT